MQMQEIVEHRARRDLTRIRGYIDQGNLPAAAAAAEACVMRFPQLSPAWYRLAQVELACADYSRAVVHAQRAVEINPERAEYFATLASAQLGFGDGIAALSSAMRAVALNPVEVPVLNALSQIFLRAGAFEQSLILVERALDVRPTSPSLLLSRAALLRALDRDVEAAPAYEALLEVAPSNGRAHYALAQMFAAGGSADDHVERLGALALRLPDSDRDATWVDYARYYELEHLGRDVEAVAALQRGAERQRKMISYDALSNARIFAQMKTWLQAWERQIDKVHATTSPIDAPVPIFIIGMPRSGTTLVERILGNHDQVQHAGESHEFAACIQQVLGVQSDAFLDEALAARFGEIVWDDVAALYRARLRQRFGDVGFVTEKLPSNYIYAAAIARALPEARLIRVVREPIDNCFSVYRQIYVDVNPFSFDQEEMARHYCAYEDWMRQVTMAIPDRMLSVRYEQLINAPQLVGRALYRFCGLDWQDEFADPLGNRKPVAFPGNMRVSRALHGDCSGRWRRYETQLQPMHRVLIDAGLASRAA